MNLVDLIERPEWMQSAACRGMDTALFYPTVGEPGTAAKRVCAGCPVAAECLAYAVNLGEHHGIWGGVAEKQRRRIRARVADGKPGPLPMIPAPISHGTIGGHRTHTRRGEPSCPACLAAWRRYRNEWKRAKRRAQREGTPAA